MTGWSFLAAKEAPHNMLAIETWSGLLLIDYKLMTWSKIWDPDCSCKEVAFIWFIWHKDVTLNEVTGMKLSGHDIYPMHVMCA